MSKGGFKKVSKGLVSDFTYCRLLYEIVETLLPSM